MKCRLKLRHKEEASKQQLKQQPAAISLTGENQRLSYTPSRDGEGAAWVKAITGLVYVSNTHNSGAAEQKGSRHAWRGSRRLWTGTSAPDRPRGFPRHQGAGKRSRLISSIRSANYSRARIQQEDGTLTPAEGRLTGPDPDEAQLSAGERLRVFSGCVTSDLLQLPYNQMEKINRLKTPVLVFGASDSRKGLKDNEVWRRMKTKDWGLEKTDRPNLSK